MKFNFLLPIFCLFFFSCSNPNDSIIENLAPNKANNKSTDSQYTYSAESNKKTFKVSAYKKDGVINNDFKFYENIDNPILEVSYSFDPNIDGWKYSEQSNVINLANTISNTSLSKKQLEEISYILDNIYTDLFNEADSKQIDREILSPIYNFKSAISANLRALKNNGIIEGTMMPTFLTGKTMFLFQEDVHIDSNILKDNLNDINSVPNVFDGDFLIEDKIKNITTETITFDEIYSLYIPKSDFIKHLNENSLFHSYDCDYENCAIGCGSDWGCCGNYKGCCYMSDKLCYLHDVICKDCTPSWFCLPGCKPDPNGNIEVKYYGISKS